MTRQHKQIPFTGIGGHAMQSLFTVLLVYCVFMGAITTVSAQETVIVSLTTNEPPPVRFGILDLESALREVGLDVTVMQDIRIPDRPAAQKYRFWVTTAGEQAANQDPFQAALGRVPEPAESYAISVARSRDWVDFLVIGRDVVGTMYGLFDLAEQVAMAGTARDLDRSIRDKRMSAGTPIRSWRLNLQHQAFEDPFSWYHTESYWTGLLDQLARARINVLELHGTLELISTKSYSLFPYLVYDDSRPMVGVGKEAANHNLQRLQSIVQMAADRGVRVFLVSNSAAWSIPDRPVDEDTGLEGIGAYTSAAVTAVLEACPALEGIGFRLGESGRGEVFYRDYFLPAMANAPQGAPILVLRSWATDQETIERLAKGYRGPTLLEIKTNGDHMGLPYPITGGQMVDWSSYGYHDFLNPPTTYQSVFEIRTAADHQIFPWADPVFIRRMIKETGFGGGVGFTIEAPSAYLPQVDILTNEAHADLGYYHWIWQRDWMWPLLWGRLGYEPDLPQDVLVHRMGEHFFQLKKEQAAQVLEALGYASAVLPAITVSTCTGPSGRDFAPELEPGPGLNDLIEKVRPLDSMMFLSLGEEIENRILGIARGRISCRDFLAWAQDSIDRAVTIMGNQFAERLILHPDEYGSGQASTLRSRWQEIEALYVDVQALQQLCATIRWRVEAAYHLGLYRHTGHYPSLQTAKTAMGYSHDAWKNFAAITTRRFQPFHQTRRMNSLAFHWAWLTERLVDDLEVLEAEEEKWQKYGIGTNWQVSFGHLPAVRVAAGEPLVIEASIPPNIPVENLNVRFRNSKGEGGNLAMGETGTPRVWATTVPEDAIKEGKIEYFITGVIAGTRAQTTQLHDNRPYIMPVGSDGEPPHIKVTNLGFDSVTGLANIELDVDDNTGVQVVRLWHKAFESDRPWEAVALPGEGNHYTGAFSIPPQGAMYCIEAVDVQSQGTMWPNVFVETPYKVIKGK